MLENHIRPKCLTCILYTDQKTTPNNNGNSAQLKNKLCGSIIECKQAKTRRCFTTALQLYHIDTVCRLKTDRWRPAGSRSATPRMDRVNQKDRRSRDVGWLAVVNIAASVPVSPHRKQPRRRYGHCIFRCSTFCLCPPCPCYGTLITFLISTQCLAAIEKCFFFVRGTK